MTAEQLHRKLKYEMLKFLMLLVKPCYLQVNLCDLLHNPLMRKRLLIMYINWIAVVLAYNGLTLNGVNLGGSVYLNMALGVIIEVPSYSFCWWSLDRKSPESLHCNQFITGNYFTYCLSSTLRGRLHSRKHYFQ